MFQSIFAVARVTFTEAVRQPIYVVLLLGVLLLLALNPALSAYTMDNDDKLLIDLGLSTLFIGGLLMAAFNATGVFSREIENKTVLTVVSKPVRRPAFVLGKYLGVTAALALAYWIWSLGFLMTVRHSVLSHASDEFDQPVLLFGGAALLLPLLLAAAANYLFRRVFASTLAFLLAPAMAGAYLSVLAVGKGWVLQPLAADFRPQLVLGLFLLLEALAILSAVALTASTRLGQVLTLVICCAVFLLGLSSDYLFGRHAAEQPFAALGYAVLPNLQYLWLADALTQDLLVDGSYVALVTGYSLVYVSGLLGLAVALFQTREVG